MHVEDEYGNDIDLNDLDDDREPEPPDPDPPLSLEEIEALVHSAIHGDPLPDSLAHLGRPQIEGDVEWACFARDLVFELGVLPQMLAELRHWQSVTVANVDHAVADDAAAERMDIPAEDADRFCDQGRLVWVRTAYVGQWSPYMPERFSDEPPL
jgi:hypothetical protein